MSTPEVRAKMKGGVRRRGAHGKWSYTIDLGVLPAQRCVDCKARFWLRIPVEVDHRFQAKPITDSTASRSAIPEQADH